MSQAVLFLAIHVVGLVFCLAVGPRGRPALCAALAFPVGLAVVVILVLLLLIAGIPYSGAALVVVVAPVAAGCGVVVARRGVDRRILGIAGAWTAGFAVVAAALTVDNVVLSTWDSHNLVMISRIVVDDGGFSHPNLARMFEWGVFQVVAQTAAELTAQDFLYGLPVVFGVSFVPVFAVTLWHGLAAVGAPRRWRAGLVALLTAALFTINMVDYHLVYLHTNLSSAVYLFGFVVLFWLAEVERDPSFVPVAFVSLTAFALQRTENPLVAVVFLALTVAQSELPRRAIGAWLAGFTVVVGAWYELLAHHVAAGGEFLSPARCRMVWALLVAALVWWAASSHRLVRRVNRQLPAIVVAVALLGLTAALVTRPEPMLRSIANWAENLRTLPYWGQSGYAMLLLVVIGLGFEPPRFRQAFVIGIPVFLVLVALLAYGGRGYRLGTGDSANRMTIHIIPLLFWYLAVKVLPATGSRDPVAGSA